MLSDWYGVDRETVELDRETGKLSKITKHKAMVNADQVIAQWETVKQHIFQLSKEGYKLEAAWHKLSTSPLAVQNPGIFLLANIRRVMPYNTCCCERGFSAMGRIKTKMRNRLYVETLDALMMISLNGPEMHEHAKVIGLVDRALGYWKAMKKRCANQARPGNKNAKRKVNHDANVTMSVANVTMNEAENGNADLHTDACETAKQWEDQETRTLMSEGDGSWQDANGR